MGPEGGSGGGTVVAEGSPEDVALVDASHTGGFLREVLGVKAKPAKKASAARKTAAKKTTARTAAKAPARKRA
jgi:excinuclease ABC subunit A